MKKKIATISFALLGLILPLSAINAEEVKITNVKVESDLLDLEGEVKNQLRAGSSTYITLSDGNTAYCIDPGEPVPGDSGETLANMKCTKTDYSAANESQQAELSYILGSSSSSATKGLALRFNLASYGTITNSEQNSTCAYIYAGYQNLTGKEKEDYEKKYGKYKSTGGTQCLQYKSIGDNSKKYEGDSGLSAGDAAYQLAASAKSSNKGGAIKPTYKVGESKGQITITVTVPKEITDAKINITCTNCFGDTGEKSLKTGDNKFVLKSDSDAEKSKCGTYNAVLSYTGNANQCSKMVQYDCSYGNQTGYQNFLACDSSTDNSGVTSEEIKGEIPCDGKTECPDPELIDDNYGGEALCNIDGETVLAINEEEKYSDYVDECVIGGTDIANASLDATKFFGIDPENGYCEISCTENYEFFSPGPLSTEDYNNGKWEIASGTSFKFLDTKAQGITDVSCYAKVDYDKLLTDVTGEANKYAQAIADEVTYCTPNYDEEGNIESYNKTVTSVYYETDTIKKSNLKVNFNRRQEEVKEPLTVVNTCVSSTKKADASVINSAKNTYVSNVKKIVGNFNACFEWKTTKVKSDCDSPIVDFIYTDGSNLGIPTELKSTQPSVTSKEYYSSGETYEKGSSSKPTNNINLGAGIGESNDFVDATYYSSHITIIDEYNIEGVGICRNYETGETSYGMTKNQCTGEGKPTTYTIGWPVSYEASYSQPEYAFIVSDYGHDFSSGSCDVGRLANVANELGLNAEYSMVCPYGMNGCQDCPWYCDPEGNCNFDNDNCDDECIWACKEVGCIFDINNGLAINYSPISLINPFNASVAYLKDQHQSALAFATAKESNSNTIAVSNDDKNGIAENWDNEKGDAARVLIEGAGESIYDDNPVFSVVLDAKAINDIREYNDNQEENGGYLNSTLKCKNDGSDYITCKSTFLDSELPKYTSEISNNIIFDKYDGTYSKKSGTGPAWR